MARNRPSLRPARLADGDIDPEAIAEAADAILSGDLVGMPTETVYGLAADATAERAVAAIFAAKGRPRFNPLIVHIAHLEAAERLGSFNDEARVLATAFWPGPLTLVVPRAPSCPIADLAGAGLATIALRVPENRIARALIETSGRPLAAPSANRSGRISPTRAEDVADDLGDRVAVILDDGPTRAGIESTIIACTGGAPRLLRPGALSREAIAACGIVLADHDTGTAAHIEAPGMLATHYAPSIPVRLGATTLGAGEAGLDFGGQLRTGIADAAPAPYRDLSPSGDLVEAAANLFAFLRALDRSGAKAIAVAPVPFEGLGEAINDRLARAAAPRMG